MNNINWERVRDLVAAECKRQQVGPVEVNQLNDAYYAATQLRETRHIDLYDLMKLAKIIEPIKAKAYRKFPVTFANHTSAPNPLIVPRAMDALIRNQCNMTTDEFVKEFLAIHPFADGNGRTAFLIYNILNSSLRSPQSLPDYFGNS